MKRAYIKLLWFNIIRPIAEEFVAKSSNNWDDSILDTLDKFVNDICEE